MSEPNWEDFRVDLQLDPPGAQLLKLFAFMEAFLNWRAEIHQKAATPKARKRRGRAAA